MTALDWWFVAGWCGIAVALAALAALFFRALKSDDEWDRLAKKPYAPPGYQSRNVNVIERHFEQWEQEVDA